MTEISGHCGYSQIGQVGRFHFGILNPNFSSQRIISINTTTTTIKTTSTTTTTINITTSTTITITIIFTTKSPLTKVRACRHSDGQFYVYRLPQQEDTMFLMMMMPMILMMRLIVTVTVDLTTMTTMC